MNEDILNEATPNQSDIPKHCFKMEGTNKSIT